jgi:long-chain acyl-CoA synthetase
MMMLGRRLEFVFEIRALVRPGGQDEEHEDDERQHQDQDGLRLSSGHSRNLPGAAAGHKGELCGHPVPRPAIFRFTRTGAVISLSAMNLATAFAQSAQTNAGKIAVFWGDREITYTGLAAQARQVAAHLSAQCAVKPGDRVGVWLRNCPEFIPAAFGILAAGGVLVPINNFLKPAEIGHIVNDAGIDVLITDAELGAQLPALRAERASLQLLQIEAFAALPEAAAGPASPRTEADLAVIIYTSGTTGRSKGAMLTHGNLLHNVESCRLALETVDQDRMAVLLPMFHSYMLTVGIFLPLLVGGQIVLVKSLQQPRLILQELVARQATILPAIPPFYRALIAAPLPFKLPFRLCISGSAPLPVQVLNEFQQKFGIPLIEGYGLSEASPVVAKNPLHGTRKAGSIGRPIPHVEMSIQDEDGNLLPPGETGEICVRGGNVMPGYWNQPGETAKVFRGGWLLTGDVGCRDAEGYYYITDRKKDMLLVNGNNVYPREIEEVIYQYPGVKEAAVVGMPDPRRGEQPVAFVVANDGATLDERALLQFLRERLADYKAPRKAVLLAALPRNATGKILKTELRQRPADA